MSLAAEDFASSGLFTACVFCLPCVFDVPFFFVLSSMLSAIFASIVVWFVLMEVWAYELSLRWLRVMVTLKVCVCCSSILSSSDTLMKGHQANA